MIKEKILKNCDELENIITDEDMSEGCKSHHIIEIINNLRLLADSKIKLTKVK